MDPKRFLFVMGDGGGNVPPQLGLARALVSRGHDVRVLTEPSVEEDVRAVLPRDVRHLARGNCLTETL